MKSLMTSANIQVLMEGTPGLDLGAIAKGEAAGSDLQMTWPHPK